MKHQIFKILLFAACSVLAQQASSQTNITINNNTSATAISWVIFDGGGVIMASGTTLNSGPNSLGCISGIPSSICLSMAGCTSNLCVPLNVSGISCSCPGQCNPCGICPMNTVITGVNTNLTGTPPPNCGTPAVFVVDIN